MKGGIYIQHAVLVLMVKSPTLADDARGFWITGYQNLHWRAFPEHRGLFCSCKKLIRLKFITHDVSEHQSGGVVRATQSRASFELLSTQRRSLLLRMNCNLAHHLHSIVFAFNLVETTNTTFRLARHPLSGVEKLLAHMIGCLCDRR